MLNLLLKTVVSQWLLFRSRQPKKLRKWRVSTNLTSIRRILQIILLNVIADILGHINTRLRHISLPASELAHLLANRNRFHETRSGIRSACNLLLLLKNSCGV